MKQPGIVVQTQQQRRDSFPVLGQAESADNAVRRVCALYFCDGVASAETVCGVELLRYDAVEMRQSARKPLLRRCEIRGGRRESETRVLFQILGGKIFQLRASDF